MKDIRADLEHLRKLFIMPNSADKFVEFGHELLEMIHDFFQEKGGIHSSISLPELSEIFNQISLPEKPQLIKDVLKEIKEKIIKHSVKVGSPYYIGHMISAIPYFMILLEMIIAALNQNQVKIETAKASSFVERELIAWLHKLVFKRKERFYKKNIQNPKVALGNVTADGTIANLTALLVAREKAFPPDGDFPGVRVTGMEGALKYYGYSRGVVIVSTRGHYSIKKAANILGIGEENVVLIPVDERNKIDIKKLRRKVRLLSEGKKSKRAKVIAIIGIAGTTETGNIDDLKALGEIAREVGAHFHVDACWGGAALLVDEYKPFFRGIERADSVTIDAHKLFYCPMTMGIVLFRNEKDLNHIKYTSQYVIRRNSVDAGRFTIEGSRPFSCLKPWAALKIIGKDGYKLLFTQAKKSTDFLKNILENCGNFEVLNSPELFIVIYRFVPQEVQDDIKAFLEFTGKKKKDKEIEHKLRKINCLINALNVKLHKELRRDDTTFVSRTRLESTKYKPYNIVVLRAVPINPLITEEILREIVSVQNCIGTKLWQEFRPAYMKLFESEERRIGLL